MGGGLLGAAKSAVAVGEKVAEGAVLAGEKAIDVAAESMSEGVSAEKVASKLAEVAAEKAKAATTAPAGEKVPNSLSKSSSINKDTAVGAVKKEPKKPADYDDYW